MRTSASRYDDPEHWRKRAQELRALSDHITHAAAKKRMLELADQYERMAQYERIVKSSEGHRG